MSPTSDSNSNPPKPAVDPANLDRARGDRLTCFITAGLALALYLPFLPTTVTGEDAGELVAAAATLGIPHPPGYPLWTMLAWATIHLVPVSTEMWRAALLSALFGAGTVWFVARVTLFITGYRLAALTSGLVLTVSYEFWEQSIIPEIYTLNAFLLVGALYFALRWAREPMSRWLYAMAVFAGLAAAHYTLSAVYLPCFALFAVATDRAPRRWSRYLGPTLCVLAAPLMYLYLPLRSRANPAMDWGNPENLHNFLDVVTRGQYAHLVDPIPNSVTVFLDRCAVFADIALWQFTPWVLTLMLAGLIHLFVVSRAAARLTATLIAVGCAMPILIPGFALEHHWVWLNTPYWIPAWVFSSIFAGLSIDAIRKHAPKGDWWGASMALFIVISPLFWNSAYFVLRETSRVDSYARDLLESLDRDAIYFSSGDHTTFPVVYLQVVEGLRPDVLLANPYGYASDALYEAVGEPPPRTRPSAAELDRLFLATQIETNRAVYSASRRTPAPNHQRVNAGLVYRYIAKGREIPAAPTIRSRRFDLLVDDWSQALANYEYAHAEARQAFDEGDADRGTDLLSTAALFIAEDKLALTSLGITAAEAGELEAAAEYFERALESDPALVPARANLARCLRELGRIEEALATIEAGLQLTPDSAPLLAEKERATAALNAADAR